LKQLQSNSNRGEHKHGIVTNVKKYGPLHQIFVPSYINNFPGFLRTYRQTDRQTPLETISFSSNMAGAQVHINSKSVFTTKKRQRATKCTTYNNNSTRVH